MGCMPYGQLLPLLASWPLARFNPSYGLHALRASGLVDCKLQVLEFQSLIWVACPTGIETVTVTVGVVEFQSLIWVACPTGEGKFD